MQAWFHVTKHLPGWCEALQTDCLTVFPTRTKAPANTTVLHLIEKLKKKGHLLDCHSKRRGGKSSHPVTVLMLGKLAELDAVINGDFDKQPTDVSVST